MNLKGKRFGYLTVKDYSHKSRGISCFCECVCGNTIYVPLSDLQSNKTISCGCIHRKRGIELLHYVDGTCIEMLQSTKIRKNNKSGHTGVFFDKNSGKWRAEIMFKGKRQSLGKFSDIEEAIKAREYAHKKLHLEFIESYPINQQINKK